MFSFNNSEDGEVKIEIWRSGFNITGNKGKAELLGTVEAKTFKQACDIVLKFDETYNSYSSTVFGCALHDNEKDARKAFG